MVGVASTLADTRHPEREEPLCYRGRTTPDNGKAVLQRIERTSLRLICSFHLARRWLRVAPIGCGRTSSSAGT